MKKRVHLIIRGRVHGVCFRMYTQEEAGRLGIAGWVRNRPDGSVEVTAEGEAGALDEMAAWCRHGPPHARVTAVDEDRSEATGEFQSFDIVH